MKYKIIWQYLKKTLCISYY